MYQTYKPFTLLSLLLAFLLFATPLVYATNDSFLDRLEQKAENKIEQMEDVDWWKTRAAVSVAGFVSGKLAGVLGAGVGAAIGLAIGGPASAGVGGYIGYRIAATVGKHFTRAITEKVVTQNLKEDKEINQELIKDSISSLDKKLLTAESVGAVIGDFIGGSLGAVAGAALLASSGSVVFPVIGAISLGYLGTKAGEKIGRFLFKKLGRLLVGGTYKALSPRFSADPFDSNIQIQIDSDGVQDNSTTAPELELQDQKYNEAYKNYIDSLESNNTQEEKNQKYQAYIDAYNEYYSIFE